MAELAGVMVGNYFLLECLGREGMVETYRARPTTRGGFDVVLRLFRPPFPDPTAFQEHFASEVEKVWHCHHEHIQPLLEFGSGEDLLYTVSEFPEGETRLASFRNPYVTPTDGKTVDTACWVRRVAVSLRAIAVGNGFD